MKGFTTRAFLAGVALQWVVACGADITANIEAEQSVAQEKLAQQPMPLFQSCTNLNFDPIAPQGFNHLRNRLSAHMTAHHSAQDLIGIPGDKVTIPAWFSYGLTTPHNLFDEEINVTLDDCNAWAGLKQWTTNDDGAIKVPVSPAYVQLGGYDVVHQVIADGSSAKSRVWGLPRGTHLVVFDVDGTLTIDNGQFIDELAAEALHKGFTPKAFAGAQQVTEMWLAKGYIPVYLTGRPHGVADITRAWLTDESFAPGPLHLAESNADILPSNSSVGEYKTKFLKELQAQGYVIDYAYGNEPTDVYGYRNAGIPMNHVFTIGAKAGVDGSTPIHGDYTSHFDYVQAQPSAVQPFAF